MNTDELLREAFQGLENRSNGLDPARVIAGAKRRRVRRIATTSVASAAVIAIGFAMTGSPEGHPPVADQPVVEPLPVIRNAQWTQLSEREWFYIDGLAWRLGNPPGTREWTGIRDILGKDAVDSAWHPETGGSGNYWSTLAFLPADVHRVKYTVRGESKTFPIEANVYRLASAPAWVIAFGDYQAPGPVAANGLVGRIAVTVDAFDASGALVVHCEPPRQTSKSAPVQPACKRVR